MSTDKTNNASAAGTSASLPSEKPKIPADAKREVGVVRWFNPRKCFGFLSPGNGSEETAPDIFVHQSQLHMPPDSFRTLISGMQVEFTRTKQDQQADPETGAADGATSEERLLAMDVTAVGGGWIVLPPRPSRKDRAHNGSRKGGAADTGDLNNASDDAGNGTDDGAPDSDNKNKSNSRQRRRNRRRKEKEEAAATAQGTSENEESGGGAVDGQDDKGDVGASNQRQANAKGTQRRNHKKKDDNNANKPTNENIGETRGRKEQWHDSLDENVRAHLAAKGIMLRGTTVDILVGCEARVKIGSEGYSTVVSKNGVVAEGNYTYTPSGEVTLQLKRALEYDPQTKTWKSVEAVSNLSSIPHSVNLLAPSASEGGDALKSIDPTSPNDPVAKAYAPRKRQPGKEQDPNDAEHGEEGEEDEAEEKEEDDAEKKEDEEERKSEDLIPQPSYEILQENGFELKTLIHRPRFHNRGRGHGKGGNTGARRGPRQRRAHFRGRGGRGGRDGRGGGPDDKGHGTNGHGPNAAD